MLSEQQHMMFRPEAQEPAANQRTSRQIKGVGRFALAKLIDSALPLRRRQITQIVLDQMEAYVGRGDLLHRLAIEQHEARAQRLVTRNNRVERGLEDASVQCAPKMQSPWQ